MAAGAVHRCRRRGFGADVVPLLRRALQLVQRHDAGAPVDAQHGVRVHLPQHDWRQWGDEQSKFPTGPIGTDFAANPPLKLGNSELMDLHPHLKDFLQLFTLNEQHGQSHHASS